MLWTIGSVLLVFWLVGLLANFGGSLIHLLLLIAGIVFVVQIFTGQRSV